MLPCPKAMERAVARPLLAGEPVLPSHEGRREETITGERISSHPRGYWAMKRLSCSGMGNQAVIQDTKQTKKEQMPLGPSPFSALTSQR